jgi:hypothetical protein
VFQKPTLSRTMISRRVLRQVSASGEPSEIVFSPSENARFTAPAAWMQPTTSLGSVPADR